MSIVRSFKSGSSFDKRAFNRKLLSVLANGSSTQARIVEDILSAPVSNDNPLPRLELLQRGEKSLTIDDIVRILEALKTTGLKVDPSPMANGASPLGQQAFYDALCEREYGKQLLQDLQKLRDQAKAERGFLKTAFTIFASETPLQKIASDTVEFELFCQQNSISFSEVAQQLAINKTKWDKVRDYKFLIAAAGGTAAGLAGLDPAIYPVLNKIPGLFFTALPFFAMPFIGLNTFKAFSQRRLSEEAGTFIRFAGIMAAGVSIGFAASGLMAGSLGTLDVSPASEQAKAAVAMLDGGAVLGALDGLLGDLIGRASQYSPGKILLPVIGGAFGLSFLYKAARNNGAKMSNALTGAFSRATVAAGDGVGKFTSYFDKAFMGFINTAGVPAIFLLLSTTLAQGGFDKFANYAGYYATVGLAMAGCATAIAGAVYAYGQRGPGFRELAKTFATAFSLSSSSATMPVTKKALETMGVSEKTRNCVVPLGATFNMMGTSLYLGMTAVCASMMLGNDPSFMEKLGVMATAIATAFGAPGIPASSIAFMTPVLETLSMTPQQMSAVFAMILLMDRPFDMLQTGLNVTGDIVVALDTDADAKGGGIRNRVANSFRWLTGRATAQEPAKPGKAAEDQPKPPAP